MWFLIALLLLTTPAMAQNVDDAAVSVSIIDMPYSKEQKDVVDSFTKNYFEETKFYRKDGDITIDKFINQPTADQDEFISDWAVKERNRLLALKADVDKQSQDLQIKIDEMNKALVDWKK